MAEELADIKAFVAGIPPFDQLPNVALSALLKLISISYVRQGDCLPMTETLGRHFYIVRKGSLLHISAENELIGKFAEGDICILNDMINTAQSGIKADEDCLLYRVTFSEFEQTFAEFSDVINFFLATSEQRLQQKMSDLADDAKVNGSLLDVVVEEIYHSPIATIDAAESIIECAQHMTARGVSSLIVLERGEILGIVTDKDIRQRCVALNIPTTTSVAEIASRDVVTISSDQNAFDALIVMNRLRIHHLPVIHNGELAGMISSTDLINKESQNAGHLTAVIQKAKVLDDLVAVALLVPQLQLRLTKIGSTAQHVGKQVTAITNALTCKLIEFALSEFGAAPMAFAWVAAGSQARHEQLCHSDQDNGLILAREPTEQEYLWFKEMAHFVCDGLAACGYIHCPGDIMATNTRWRQAAGVWEQYFQQWIEKPTPMALLNATVFFDMTSVYGDEVLLFELRKSLLIKTKDNTLFEAHMSKNALEMKPPLGFFRDFVLVSKGEHKNTLDLKRSGIAPIVELARIYALSLGIDAVNTIERLKRSAGSAVLTQASADSLIDAFEFLGALRLEHQAQLIALNAEPDNYLPPKDISKLEREHLKDAFKVIKALQNVREKAF